MSERTLCKATSEKVWCIFWYSRCVCVWVHACLSMVYMISKTYQILQTTQCSVLFPWPLTIACSAQILKALTPISLPFLNSLGWCAIEDSNRRKQAESLQYCAITKLADKAVVAKTALVTETKENTIVSAYHLKNNCVHWYLYHIYIRVVIFLNLFIVTSSANVERLKPLQHTDMRTSVLTIATEADLNACCG